MYIEACSECAAVDLVKKPLDFIEHTMERSILMENKICSLEHHGGSWLTASPTGWLKYTATKEKLNRAMFRNLWKSDDWKSLVPSIK